MKQILDIVDAHKKGRRVGVYSVCSAHPMVIAAALRRARSDGSVALIEATSNQVNQYGGYTGMQPADFCDLVHGIADEADLPLDRVVLGGDHLGPNCWQSDDAEVAMCKSEMLIDQYVDAGFRKIHLDCSMACGGDRTPLDDATIADRAARLCAVAEARWRNAGGEAPVYVVGTEVPVPGGVVGEDDDLAVTEPAAALETVAAHKKAFCDAGLEAAWERVVGLVVQPGVEFGNEKVDDYVADKTRDLSRIVEGLPHVVYEAHSTDYQTPENLRQLVRDHFAILKVGPGLTFALREALWALHGIAVEWFGADRAPQLRETVLKVMEQHPKYWRAYYSSTGSALRRDLQFSLSDRIRYYWPYEAVENVVGRLLAMLEASPPPLPLIKQYLPAEYRAIRSGEIRNHPQDLIQSKIDEVLVDYANACGHRRAI